MHVCHLSREHASSHASTSTPTYTALVRTYTLLRAHLHLSPSPRPSPLACTNTLSGAPAYHIRRTFTVHTRAHRASCASKPCLAHTQTAHRNVRKPCRRPLLSSHTVHRARAYRLRNVCTGRPRKWAYARIYTVPRPNAYIIWRERVPLILLQKYFLSARFYVYAGFRLTILL